MPLFLLAGKFIVGDNAKPRANGLSFAKFNDWGIKWSFIL